MAAIRYLYDAIANLKGRPPRLGGQLAQGLNVTRQAIGSVADGEYRKTIAADQTPPQIKRLIDRAVGHTATGSDRAAHPVISAEQ